MHAAISYSHQIWQTCHIFSVKHNLKLSPAFGLLQRQARLKATIAVLHQAAQGLAEFKCPLAVSYSGWQNFQGGELQISMRKFPPETCLDATLNNSMLH